MLRCICCSTDFGQDLRLLTLSRIRQVLASRVVFSFSVLSRCTRDLLAPAAVFVLVLLNFAVSQITLVVGSPPASFVAQCHHFADREQIQALFQTSLAPHIDPTSALWNLNTD